MAWGDGRRRLGLFDPPSIQPYTKYGLKDLSAPAHLAALADAAAQSFVRILSNEICHRHRRVFDGLVWLLCGGRCC